MQVWTVVALGGAIGAMLRYMMTEVTASWSICIGFPLSILLCNILGSLVIGLITGFLLLKGLEHSIWRYFWIIGVCGGFTTFSSFSLDAVNLISSGMWLRGLLYVFSSLFLCLLATSVGLVGVKFMVPN